MRKVISYRQKVIELAKIYKIDRVLDPNLKLTTYEIELELLKNKVPIPSRRGYFSHKIINEISRPIYIYLKDKATINFSFKKNLKKLSNHINTSLKQNLSINFSLSKSLKIIFNNIINFLNKILRITFNKIDNYINFILFNINNFFKVLTGTIINSLNDIYHFKIDEKLVKKYVLRGTYSFLAVMLISSGFYIKNLINNVDGLKISVEIKSDKKEIVKSPEVDKKNKSKGLAKKPYDPESDYTLNTQTVLNLFKD